MEMHKDRLLAALGVVADELSLDAGEVLTTKQPMGTFLARQLTCRVLRVWGVVTDEIAIATGLSMGAIVRSFSQIKITTRDDPAIVARVARVEAVATRMSNMWQVSLSCADVVKAVISEHYGASISAILKSRQNQPLAVAKKEAAYLLHVVFSYSAKSCCVALGTHHTSFANALRDVEDSRDDPDIDTALDAMEGTALAMVK